MLSLVRHGNVTSVRDCVPCESFPYSFVVRYQEFNLFMSILDQSLAQGRPKLEPFGVCQCGAFARHR